jgi:hypothetical protein
MYFLDNEDIDSDIKKKLNTDFKVEDDFDDDDQ